MSEAEGTLVVQRSAEWRRDAFRSYQIWVDGAAVTAVKRGRTVRVPVPAGRHEVQARVDWCSSPVCPVEVPPGGEATLHVGPSRSSTPLAEVLDDTGNYLFLRPGPLPA